MAGSVLLLERLHQEVGRKLAELRLHQLWGLVLAGRERTWRVRDEARHQLIPRSADAGVLVREEPKELGTANKGSVDGLARPHVGWDLLQQEAKRPQRADNQPRVALGSLLLGVEPGVGCLG